MVEAAVRTDNWGRWGVDDERGALNLLTPEVVRRAGGCIRTGKVCSLGLPIKQHETPIAGYRNPPVAHSGLGLGKLRQTTAAHHRQRRQDGGGGQAGRGRRKPWRRRWR